MSTIPSSIPLPAARALLLTAQGIEPGPEAPATKSTVRKAIQRMGQLQIDTISVVNRSPYLVLHSRIGDFETVWLEQLLAQRKIFEAWSHEACFLPIEDYPFAAARFAEEKPWKKRYRAFIEEHRDKADELIELIRTNGPVRSADFEREEPAGGGWWNQRKHEKHVLEGLFADGTVMIVRRDNFQRVYGLTRTSLARLAGPSHRDPRRCRRRHGLEIDRSPGSDDSALDCGLLPNAGGPGNLGAWPAARSRAADEGARGQADAPTAAALEAISIGAVQAVAAAALPPTIRRRRDIWAR